MKSAAQLWVGVLAAEAVIAVPIVVPALIWGKWGAAAGGIFWFVVALSLLTVAFVAAMDERK